jgi:hypothetical protein
MDMQEFFGTPSNPPRRFGQPRVVWHEIKGLFRRASQLSHNPYLTEEEWEKLNDINGAKYFKRLALGVCGKTRVFSSKELSDLFIKTKIARDEDEARQVLGLVSGNEVLYSKYSTPFQVVVDDETKKYLQFREVFDKTGGIYYRVSVNTEKSMRIKWGI